MSSASTLQVELESLVQQGIQRQVPLPGVLDRLAAGADLELDQADVRVVGVEGVGDAAEVVDLGALGQGVLDHRPLDAVGAAHLALLRGGGAVGVPGVGADPDRDGGCHEVALVPAEPQRDPVRLLGVHGVDHGLEVRQRPRGEVVALGGVRVEVVERLEVGRLAPGDLDPLLGGLLDVAAPLLVHARQHFALGLSGQRDLEVVRRLAGREAALDRDLAPAETFERAHQARPDRGAFGGREVTEAAYRVVGDAGLDRCGLPPAQHHRGPHPDREGTSRLEVLGHRGEPGGEVVGVPVEDRALGEVGEVALDLGQLPEQDEADSDEPVAVVPAQGLRAPLRLHLRPGGRLEEAGTAATAQEIEVVGGRDLGDAILPRHLLYATGPGYSRSFSHSKSATCSAAPPGVSQTTGAFASRTTAARRSGSIFPAPKLACRSAPESNSSRLSLQCTRSIRPVIASTSSTTVSSLLPPAWAWQVSRQKPTLSACSQDEIASHTPLIRSRYRVMALSPPAVFSTSSESLRSVASMALRQLSKPVLGSSSLLT